MNEAKNARYQSLPGGYGAEFIGQSVKVLATALDNAGAMPLGLPRTKATLEVAQRARQMGAEAIEMSAGLELITCYLHSKNTGKALESFSNCLSDLLHRPGNYTWTHVGRIAAYYPQICQAACHHPDIPLSLIGPLLAGMEAFLQGTEPSLATAYFLRHQVREPLGLDTQEVPFLNKAISVVSRKDSRALRRAIDICQIGHYGASQPEQSLAMAHRMLTHELPPSQRGALLRAMLIPLVHAGAWQEAWEAHLVSYQYDRYTAKAANLGPHLQYLCQTQNYSRLVKLLARHLGVVRHAQDPWDLLQILHYLVASLEALEMSGHGQAIINTAVAGISRWQELPALSRPTVRQAREQLGASLRELSLRFDQRNGTSQVSSHLGVFTVFDPPEGTFLLSGEADGRVLAKMLRIRALLECEQPFDALLLLGSLRESKFPAVQKLHAELDMLTTWARWQLQNQSTPGRPT